MLDYPKIRGKVISKFKHVHMSNIEMYTYIFSFVILLKLDEKLTFKLKYSLLN